jgi:polysaccharide deacetylase
MIYLLHNIGPKQNSNYNTREELIALARSQPGAQLTFDGIYLNVWENRDLLKLFAKPPILFIMGNYIGGDNTFDEPMPYEKYCGWDHILDLVTNYNCLLGWHTCSHQDLTTLGDREVLAECTPPFQMEYFAYPYGNVDLRVEEIVRSIGYAEAFSVHQGHGGPFQRIRGYL